MNGVNSLLWFRKGALRALCCTSICLRYESMPVCRAYVIQDIGVERWWGPAGLRLHDNPALHAALDRAEHVTPVFCLDPWFMKESRVGINRYQFLLESLQDLDSRCAVSRQVLDCAPVSWCGAPTSLGCATKLHFQVASSLSHMPHAFQHLHDWGQIKTRGKPCTSCVRVTPVYARAA